MRLNVRNGLLNQQPDLSSTGRTVGCLPELSTILGLERVEGGRASLGRPHRGGLGTL